MATYKIAVLGAGNIGGSIGRKWVAAGHQVAFGVNNLNGKNATALKSDLGDKITVGTLEEALATGPDIVLLAVPGGRVADVITQNAAQLDGKVIFDATNNFGSPTKNVISFLQQYTPNAQIYRAFNNMIWENFVDSDYHGIQADAFYCGDETGRETAEQLINEAGVNPVYVGGVDKGDLVDSLLGLFVALATGQKRGRNLAFKLLTR